MVSMENGFSLAETVDLHGEVSWLRRWSASPLRVVVGGPRFVDMAGRELVVDLSSERFCGGFSGGESSLLLMASFAPVFCVLAFVSFSLLPGVVVAFASVRFDLLPFIFFGVVRIDW
ncbi:unnamed protein product [Arabidopsis halleri]